MMENNTLYPIDTAVFEKIRKEGYLYVDKTAYIHQLTQKGTFYFLARPRRFGKSLFINTLEEYFNGNRSLFQGLAIDKLQPDKWKSYPVLHLDLSGKIYLNLDDLLKHIERQLDLLEKKYETDKSYDEIDRRFADLIQKVSITANTKVVILIDEYDSPLTSAIDKPELQKVYREQLQGFYSVLKNSEKHIKFCMLTGVTRFGKVSIFSGLNNLNDITFDNEYAAVCGITEKELTDYYDKGVMELANKFDSTKEKIYERLKEEYDGYHFSSSLLDVYNPYSLNHVFTKLEFQDYWCKSGVPTILSKSLLQNDFDVESLNGRKEPETALSDLSMFGMDPIPLFYQTGYLTIKAYEARRRRYTLGYPNREVEAAIMRNILKVYMNAKDDRQGMVYDMEDAFEDGNPKQFLKLLGAFLSDIPSKLHEYVDRYENYYHTIFYCLTSLIGLDVDAEYNTSEGFIDMLIKTSCYIYVIELKINGNAEDAIKQIEEKHYCRPFESDPRKLFRIGIGFSKTTHSIESSIID